MRGWKGNFMDGIEVVDMTAAILKFKFAVVGNLKMND